MEKERMYEHVYKGYMHLLTGWYAGNTGPEGLCSGKLGLTLVLKTTAAYLS